MTFPGGTGIRDRGPADGKPFFFYGQTGCLSIEDSRLSPLSSYQEATCQTPRSSAARKNLPASKSASKHEHVCIRTRTRSASKQEHVCKVRINLHQGKNRLRIKVRINLHQGKNRLRINVRVVSASRSESSPRQGQSRLCIAVRRRLTLLQRRISQFVSAGFLIQTTKS